MLTALFVLVFTAILCLQFCYKIRIDFSGLCIREDINCYFLPFGLNSVRLKLIPTLYSWGKGAIGEANNRPCHAVEFLLKFLGFVADVCCVLSVLSDFGRSCA